MSEDDLDTCSSLLGAGGCENGEDQSEWMRVLMLRRTYEEMPEKCKKNVSNNQDGTRLLNATGYTSATPLRLELIVVGQWSGKAFIAPLPICLVTSPSGLKTMSTFAAVTYIPHVIQQ